jgi:hypothetical protein
MAVQQFNAGMNYAKPIFVSFACRIVAMTRKITLMSSNVRKMWFPANFTLPQIK